MNHDGENDCITTLFGGFMTIIITIICILYMVQQTIILFEHKRGVEFGVTDLNSDDNFKNVTHIMSDYDDSFNMLFGIAENDMDWFNNPYLELNVYEVTQDWEV